MSFAITVQKTTIGPICHNQTVKMQPDRVTQIQWAQRQREELILEEEDHDETEGAEQQGQEQWACLKSRGW